MDRELKYKVVNANYERVLYYIDKILSETDGHCRCSRCRMDVAALAMNTLPPHYYVSPTHREEKDPGSPWILIEMAVREALDRVNLYPHHETPVNSAGEGLPASEKPIVIEETGTDG